MRNVTIVAVLVLCFCKNGLSQKKKVLANDLVAETPLYLQPSFTETLKKFKNDPNVFVADTCSRFTGAPYVICFMQIHTLDSFTSRLYGEKSENLVPDSTKIVQLELLKSIKKLKGFRIYYEGFNRKFGRITLASSLNQTKMSNPSELDNYVAKNLKNLNVYGVESWEIQGKVNALMALRGMYIQSVNFLRTPMSVSDRQKFVRNFVMGFELVFNVKELGIENVEESKLIDKDFISSYEKGINDIQKDVISMRNTIANNPQGWAQVFMSLDGYITEKEQNLYTHERNIDIVKNLPDTVNSILVLGIAHFSSQTVSSFKTGTYLNLYYSIEYLLYERRLNYIVLCPMSLKK